MEIQLPFAPDESSDPDREPRPPIARRLAHPVTKLKLIRELALTNKTQDQLAEEYGVVQSSISEFKTRNADAINAIREDAADEFAGIWIADKANRVMAYKEQVDYLVDRMAREVEDDPHSALRVAQSALKSAAEEMGQLTVRTRSEVSGDVLVRSEVVGVDPADI